MKREKEREREKREKERGKPAASFPLGKKLHKKGNFTAESGNLIEFCCRCRDFPFEEFYMGPAEYIGLHGRERERERVRRERESEERGEKEKERERVYFKAS